MQKLRTLLPLFLLIYIGVETYFKMHHISLCESTGCKMAGDLLKFNPIYLNFLGIGGAFVLFILSLIKSEITTKLYEWLIAVMASFETLLIASQFAINPEPCKFCLGVYAFLLVIFLVTNWKRFIFFIPVFLAVFVGMQILAVPKNSALIKKDGLYLIASKTCPHCKAAKKFLNEKNISYNVIPSSNINALYMAKTLGISKIPIAIKKEKEIYTIIVGDKSIKNFFKPMVKTQKNTKIEKEIKEQKSFDIRKLYQREEGCSISFQQTSSCEGEKE